MREVGTPGVGSILRGVEAHAGTGWAEHARAVLQQAGRHRGAARDELIELLAHQDCALSAMEIEDTLRRERPGRRAVGRASVYRVLELLQDHDLVNRLDVGDGIARYELVDPAGGHHHHLLCEQCGQLVPFHDRALERSINQLSDRLGFDTKDHEVILRGDCPECRN
jgi:Fur family transcriptional regulator, ferric uptake regulator